MIYVVEHMSAALPSYPFTYHESILSQDHNYAVHRNSCETQLPAQALSLVLAPQQGGSRLQSVYCFGQPEAAPAEIQLSLVQPAETQLPLAEPAVARWPLAEPAETQLPLAEPAEARLPMVESFEGQLPLAETAETGLRLAVRRCPSLVVQLSKLQSEVNCLSAKCSGSVTQQTQALCLQHF